MIASEKKGERRAYYELPYETGASQTDAANLRAENIDQRDGVLVYRRQKLGPLSESARLTIGNTLRQLLQRCRSPAICSRVSNWNQPKTGQLNFADVAESLEYDSFKTGGIVTQRNTLVT